MKKFLSFAMFAMMFAVGCSGVGGDEELTPDPEPEKPAPGDTSGLVASVTPSVIKANGEDVALIEVLYNGEPVDISEVTFYDNETNKSLGWTTYEYTTTTPGTVVFWVAYKTQNTKDKPLTITAEAEELVPDHVDDPEPENTQFAHRSLLIDFTSVKCGYCPMMAATMNAFEADEHYADKVVITACHCSGMGTDPFVPADASAFERWIGVTGYPCMSVDFRYRLDGTYEVAQNVQIIGQRIDSFQQEDAKAGISATVKTNGVQVAVLATVKAAETANYRIGAFLLEDDLYAQQSNYTPSLAGDFNTHNHVIRLIDCKQSSTDFTGLDLGEIEAGETAEHLFLWDFNSAWTKENCSVVIFVTTPDSRGVYYVTNAVHAGASLAGEYPFEYAE